MGDLSQSTVAFLDTLKLEEGHKRIYNFSSEKEADSFRVSLYTIKRKLRDNTILISISGKAVTMLKKSKAVEVTQVAPDGTITEVSKEQDESRFQKKVEEIISDAEGLPEDLKADFIREAIEQLNTSRR